MGKGFNGLVLKAFGADDYRLAVTGVEAVTEKYLRLSFTADGLLADQAVHPTQWIRLWFPDTAGGLQQRGYTLVDPDPERDAFDIEFALHGGPASQWAANASIGDTIDATVLGSKFAVPEPKPAEFVIFGDTASLPAVNSLLDAIGPTPARVWLEWQFESDRDLPVRTGPNTVVTWLPRVDNGKALQAQADEVVCAPDTFGWAACDAATQRAIVKSLRAKLPKSSIGGRAYWK